MPNRRLYGFPLLLVFLAGCGSEPDRAPAIGEAFAGPATLNLRLEISLRSKVVAAVKHGEKLEIIQRHRRFLKVRTAQGAEGWTDNRQLMSLQQMADLRRLGERSAKLPSQGKAISFDAFNIHAEPNRQSPSFHQLAGKEAVDLIGHRLVPRSAPAPPPLVKGQRTPPKAARPSRPQRGTPARIPPLPMPVAPGPPSNWMELSRTPAGAPPSAPPRIEQAAAGTGQPPPAVSMEDWSLVRTSEGYAGWVRTRMLRMAIPDEVAQYAEGRRITSYFPLGEVRDGEEIKRNWLWTTIASGSEPYQFDGFRVFVWSLRRHRYETAYIERNVKGYYPVEVHSVDIPSKKGPNRSPGFSVIVESRDGTIQRRTYAFQGYRVVLISKQPWQLTAAPGGEAQATEPGPQPAVSADQTWFRRLQAAVSKWWKR